jgi:anti-sigma regulatory factor (Ser/Thr protein kinase)
VTGETTTLPPVPRSVPEARRFVCETLTALGAPGACDDAAALVSELATNAVLHARTQFTIAVTRDAETVRIWVHDLSAVLPRQRTYGVDSTTGRGIRLIASLASDWGVDREVTGKSIWFELPTDGTTSVNSDIGDTTIDIEALLAYGDDSPPSAFAMAA